MNLEQLNLTKYKSTHENEKNIPKMRSTKL